MRLIDADKLYPDRMTKDGLAISQSQIANAPTVEKRPHGEWIDVTKDDDYFVLWYKCSACGYHTNWHLIKEYRFCPNCGARMKEGDEK